MPKYTVRVTRAFEEDTVDLDIEAHNWEEAKAEAIKEAKSDPGMYFGGVPNPEFYVDMVDDDEEAALEDEDVCRTCGEPYEDGGDGFDGECPDCADKTDQKLHPENHDG